MSPLPLRSSANTDGAADAPSLRPHAGVLFAGAGAIALLSALTLPWPIAIASTVLGVLMIAGADVDARTHLLPDLVTGGTVASGALAAYLLEPFDPWAALAEAAARAFVLAGALFLVRLVYGRLRGREGLGLGDVKLAAGIGVWLSWDAIPACLALAAGAALIAVLLARRRGESIERTMRIPFGAFLCPALWLVFYANTIA